MNTEKEMYIINSKTFASAIKFLIGVDYVEIPHHKLKGRSVFGFENTELLQSTIAGLMELRKTINK